MPSPVPTGTGLLSLASSGRHLGTRTRRGRGEPTRVQILTSALCLFQKLNLRGAGEMRNPVPPRTKVFRCAIYTRKSSEEGLEQDFNSRHAQRESCEADINSQRHKG